MGLLEELKPSLKTKWLDYYEHNQSWLDKYARDFGRCNNDAAGGGTHLDSDLILLAITALEPKLEQILELIFDSYSALDCDRIIQKLGLDFDVKKELKKRKIEKSQQAHEELKKRKTKKSEPINEETEKSKNEKSQPIDEELFSSERIGKRLIDRINDDQSSLDEIGKKIREQVFKSFPFPPL